MDDFTTPFERSDKSKRTNQSVFRQTISSPSKRAFASTFMEPCGEDHCKGHPNKRMAC